MNIKSKNMRKKNLLLIILGLMVLAVILIPYNSTSVPEWKITTINSLGQPLTQIKVTQTWFDYGVLGEKKEVRISDSEGNVIFPERRFSCSLAFRVLFRFFDSVNQISMMHGASEGGTAVISAGIVYPSHIWYKNGGELKKVIVVEDGE